MPAEEPSMVAAFSLTGTLASRSSSLIAVSASSTLMMLAGR